MKTIDLKIIIPILLLLLMGSCTEDITGQGPVVTQEVLLDPFSKVNMKISGEVTIVQGNEQEVLITGQENIINRIKTRINNEKWAIEFDNGSYRYNRLEIQITVPDVQMVELSGSGYVRIRDFEEQGNMQFRLTGSGEIDLENIEGPENIELLIDGSGTINTFGVFSELSMLDISIPGSGNFNGFELSTRDCNVSIAGSGNCEVLVQESLSARISGSGSVFYKGDPSVSSDITGSGRVVDAN
jgi:hypothetical protein